MGHAASCLLDLAVGVIAVAGDLGSAAVDQIRHISLEIGDVIVGCRAGRAVGVISGAYSAYTAVKNGATAGEAALCFAVSATVTTASIGNLANLGTESALSIVATASADLVFGTGYNCIAAATNKAVSMKAEERKASGTQTTSTTRSRNTQKRGNKRTGYTMCLY